MNREASSRREDVNNQQRNQEEGYDSDETKILDQAEIERIISIMNFQASTATEQ
ncbi:hypothetical protein D3C87_2022670 [compost metagenome]